MPPQNRIPQSAANHGGIDRARFWLYCQRTANAARHRSRAKSLPYDIDAHAIDELLVSQGWRCAVSNLPLIPSAQNKSGRHPFGPSLDRIVPHLGYARGNVRVICNMANFAINEWGIEALHKFVEAMSRRTPLLAGGGG